MCLPNGPPASDFTMPLESFTMNSRQSPSLLSHTDTHPLSEPAMSKEASKDKNIIRIDLTPSQQAQVLDETGKQADAIELTTSELEERIAPKMMNWQ